ncbi:MAG TPA: prepilin-type N-terminal cleavage/methylation domain-containing protein [Thermoanaerobaculia bacterium]|nr:prepilin-type N-terminal cleavage/methylation domain-containing protein [Thermoanaerobaculia bacterium]
MSDRSRDSGFTLIEVVVTLSIAGTIIFMVVMLQAEMLRFDRSFRMNLMTHPELHAVLARVRRDVVDARDYLPSAGAYTQSPTALILAGLDPQGAPVTIVWDFSENSRVRRLAIDSSAERVSEWTARGVLRFTVTSYTMPDGETAVRLRGYDSSGNLRIEQIIEPRGHS